MNEKNTINNVNNADKHQSLQQKILHEETDLYNFTMDSLGPDETNTGYSVWQAIPRDVGTYTKPRVMAGGRAILREYQKHYANSGLEFALLPDGMPFLAGDPVVQVMGDKSIARKLEPKVLSILFYMTEIATRTKELVDEFGANRILDVGMRGAAPGAWSFSAEAFLMGGGKLTSNTSLKNVPGLVEGRDYTLVGTTGHSLYLEYLAAGYSQKEAFSTILDKFENKFPNKSCSLLVDTVESMLGINQALDCIKAQKEETGQTHYIRLDSGDLLNQAIYALREMVPKLPDFKVIIEDGLTVEKVRKYEAAIKLAGFDPKKHVLYGLGGYFVNNITRDANGAWAYKPSIFRTKNNGDVNVIKLSSTPLKNSLPGFIGINFNAFSNRLDLHNSYSINKIFAEKDFSNYYTRSVDELLLSSKPFWKMIEERPKKWTEHYDMSPALVQMQHDAMAKTFEFGYNNKNTLLI